MSLTITVHGHPAPQGSKRHVGNGIMVESSKAAKPWREAVKHAALDVINDAPQFVAVAGDGEQRPGVVHEADWSSGAIEYSSGATRPIAPPRVSLLPLDGPLAVSMVFTIRKPAGAPKSWRTWPRKKPDLSKLARCTEDALTDAGVWTDDARVIQYDRLAKCFPSEGDDALPTPGAVIRVREVTS